MPCFNSALGSYQKWFIGNVVRSILVADEEVSEQVGNKVFPLVAPENTVGDFIVYSRQKYAKDTVKTGVYQYR